MDKELALRICLEIMNKAKLGVADEFSGKQALAYIEKLEEPKPTVVASGSSEPPAQD